MRSRLALGAAFVASAAGAGIGGAVPDTSGVSDGLAASIVALGLVVWAGVWAGTRAGGDPGEGSAGGDETGGDAGGRSAGEGSAGGGETGGDAGGDAGGGRSAGGLTLPKCREVEPDGGQMSQPGDRARPDGPIPAGAGDAPGQLSAFECAVVDPGPRRDGADQGRHLTPVSSENATSEAGQPGPGPGAVWPGAVGPGRPGAPGPGAVWPGAAGILTATVLVRLPWLFAAPIFSDDVYRYVWEGRVWAAGFNPFASAPVDPVLTPLRDAVWAQVNHPEVSSIYPPVAQLLFVLLAPGGVLAWKLLGTLADCGTAALLGRRSARSGWLWALLPLTALESAGSGHLESVGVFLLVLALSEDESGRRRSAMAVAWAGAMVKLLPGAVLLPLVRGWRARLGIALATAIAMAPILAAGPGAFRGFETYRAVWAFNGGAYPLLATLFGDASGDPARKLLQLVGAAWVGIVVWRSRGRADAPVAVAMAATGAFVLLSPTVHPWYVLWSLAVGLWADQPAPSNGRSPVPWTLAAVLVPLAYRVLGTLHAGVWHEEAVTRWVIWVPVWGALVRTLWRRRPW